MVWEKKTLYLLDMSELRVFCLQTNKKDNENHTKSNPIDEAKIRFYRNWFKNCLVTKQTVTQNYPQRPYSNNSKAKTVINILTVNKSPNFR